MNGRKPLIGITGVIGSGKSAAAGFFRELGAAVFDADRASREITEQADVLQQIRRTFGEEVIDKHGNLKREKMAEKVFHNPAQLEKLNGIIHPRVRRQMWRFVEKMQQDRSVKMIIIDAPLIYETDLHRFLDRIVVVSASVENCIARVTKRSSMTRDAILQRMKRQIPLSEKRERADFVIENDGDLNQLAGQVKNIFQNILQQWS